LVSLLSRIDKTVEIKDLFTQILVAKYYSIKFEGPPSASSISSQQWRYVDQEGDLLSQVFRNSKEIVKL